MGSVDSWAEPEDDEAPAGASTAGAASAPASASGPADASRLRSASTSGGPAAAAIAAYDALTTTGKVILRDLNNPKNRSSSAGKRDRENEKSIDANTDKRN